MSKVYRVKAACAQVPTSSTQGSTIVTLYQGATLPSDIAPDRLRHLLDAGLVEEVADLYAPYPDGVDTPSQVSSVGGQPVASALDSATESRRAAAREKLPQDGSAPRATHGEDVWVEYAVAQGMDRGEAEQAGKAELMRRYKDAGKSTAKPADEAKPTAAEDAELMALRKRAVEQGMDKDEVEKASADDLRDLVK